MSIDLATMSGNSLASGEWYPDATWHSFIPYIQHCYPVYYPMWIEQKNKIEQAFKVVQLLVDKDLIKKPSVEQFIDLVNEISKQL